MGDRGRVYRFGPIRLRLCDAQRLVLHLLRAHLVRVRVRVRVRVGVRVGVRVRVRVSPNPSVPTSG